MPTVPFLPPKERASDEAFAACIKKLKEHCTKQGTSFHGFVSDGGSILKEMNGAGCHGGFLNCVGSPVLHYTITHQNFTSSLLKNRDVSRYTDWLLNRSPWHTCIDPRVTFEIADKLGFVQDLEYPGQFIHGLNCASRYRSEHPKVLANWLDIVEDGFPNEDMAFFIASLFYNSNTLNSSFHGSAIYCSIGKDPAYLENFMNHKVVTEGLSSYKKKQGYSGCCTLWGQPVLMYSADYVSMISNKSAFEKILAANRAKLKQSITESDAPKKRDPFGRDVLPSERGLGIRGWEFLTQYTIQEKAWAYFEYFTKILGGKMPV